jgi:mersacidin/lichenicidin family type 2 lantibiotic
MAIDVIRAWKDPEYRKTLTSEELASLPANPAGSANLTENELREVAAGRGTLSTLPCIFGVTAVCGTEVVSVCGDDRV